MSQLQLCGGDYIPDGKGSFCRVTAGEELLQRVLLRLTARRGGCPFLPTFGSRLYLLCRAKPNERAALAGAYVKEALADEPEIELTDVMLDEKENGRGDLTVSLVWHGENLKLTMEV